MEERGAALMEEEQMETVGRGTGGEESSNPLARTWFYNHFVWMSSRGQKDLQGIGSISKRV